MVRVGALVSVPLLALALTPAPGNASLLSRSGTPTVSVSITDARLTLSTRSLPTGEAIFAVTNHGKLHHRFRIAGKSTPDLTSGQSSTLKVDFRHPGTYIYAATGLSAHATGTLKLVGITTAPPPTAPPPPTTVSTSAQPCTNPAATTVTVTMTDTFGPTGYTFAPASFPCGTVTFVLNNVGLNQHGLGLKSPTGMEPPAGTSVDPHQTTTETVSLPVKGSYQWWDAEGEGFETTYGTVVVQ